MPEISIAVATPIADVPAGPSMGMGGMESLDGFGDEVFICPTMRAMTRCGVLGSQRQVINGDDWTALLGNAHGLLLADNSARAERCRGPAGGVPPLLEGL